MIKARPAVFLDRDGTINEQMGYINHLDRFIMLPGVDRAVSRLNEAGLPVVVVSNQSGVARGYFPEELVNRVNEMMVELLARAGARLDAVYYCPHHPRAEVAAYRRECDCRKPKPGLLLRAAADLGLDLTRSFAVGDRTSDLKAARAVGAKAILVLTGYGRGEREYVLPHQDVRPDWVAEDLMSAVEWILSGPDRA
ncbi:MAG: D-glycero-beta-D-manno-heptose 1,7-bisphosphate 7-phosphatase [Thermodesulfobacteriota bacterium]